MLNPPVKRLILPFAPQKNRQSLDPRIEEAAVYALAELERTKGGGLIVRQPEEKITFIAKIQYPIWLLPKEDVAYFFDGLNNSSYTFAYIESPPAKAFIDSFEEDSKNREDFEAFLADHKSYFSYSKKEKIRVFKNLIADPDFEKEFSIYRKEASELTGPQVNIALLPPSFEESTAFAELAEIEGLRSSLKGSFERFSDALRYVTKATTQYVTELDYAAEAVRDEANAKIKAQEEFINPKIAKLNTDYKQRIAEASRSFDKELESLEKQRAQTVKHIESDEGKIRLYQREAETQASKNHLVYEKRWKQKSAQAKKELNGFKKALKRTEKNIKNTAKQKNAEVAKLHFELDAEVKHARLPLQALERYRDAKMLTFKRERERLLKLEKPVVDGLEETIKIGEHVAAKFSALGVIDQLRNPALYYVPLYVICYRSSSNSRFTFLAPSMANDLDLSVRLKGALGKSKLRQLFFPRFKSIGLLVDKVQVLARQDPFFDSKIRSLGEQGNFLNLHLTRNRFSEGLDYLRAEGWLSDKEHQAISSSLA